MCHLESKTKGLQYIPGDRKYPLADNRATRYCKIDDLQGLYNALQCFSPVLPVCILAVKVMIHSDTEEGNGLCCQNYGHSYVTTVYFRVLHYRTESNKSTQCENSLSYGLQRNVNLMLLNKQFKVLKLLKFGLKEIEKL